MIRIITILLLVLFSTTAHARHHHRTVAVAPACWGWFCPDAAEPGPRAARHQRTHHGAALRDHGASVVHPSGCPRRAFCGCGTAVRLLGAPVRSLYLAANWLRFPRTAPAPDMAAARRGHVMALISHVGGDDWLVYDPNSGGHATRIHVRSIRGYAIVNPRA